MGGPVLSYNKDHPPIIMKKKSHTTIRDIRTFSYCCKLPTGIHPGAKVKLFLCSFPEDKFVENYNEDINNGQLAKFDNRISDAL